MNNSFIVRNDFIGSRLDRWFRKNICDVPQSLIEKNIRKGNIRVNKKKEKGSYRIKKNDYPWQGKFRVKNTILWVF